MRLSPRSTAAFATGLGIGVALLFGVDGWPGDRAFILLGYPDCETFRDGIIRQPIAAFTSLAFVPLGLWAIDDRRVTPAVTRIMFGIGFIGVGMGSFLGHAAQTDWGRRIDSLAIKLMLAAFLAAIFSRWQSRTAAEAAGYWFGASVVLFAVEVQWPATGDALLVSVAALAAGLLGLNAGPAGRRWLAASLATLGLAYGAWWLGRSTGSLCEPSSWFQLHGIWHILAAAGVAFAYQAYRSDMA